MRDDVVLEDNNVRGRAYRPQALSVRPPRLGRPVRVRVGYRLQVRENASEAAEKIGSARVVLHPYSYGVGHGRAGN